MENWTRASIRQPNAPAVSSWLARFFPVAFSLFFASKGVTALTFSGRKKASLLVAMVPRICGYFYGRMKSWSLRSVRAKAGMKNKAAGFEILAKLRNSSEDREKVPRMESKMRL